MGWARFTCFWLLGATVSSCQSFDQASKPAKEPVRELTSFVGENPLTQASLFYVLGESANLQGDLSLAKVYFGRSYELDPNAFLGAKFITTEARIGEPRRALLEARKARLRYPTSPEIRLVNANLLGHFDQFDEAIAETKAALGLMPSLEAAHVQLIRLYEQHRQIDNARMAAVTMTKTLPQQPLAWSILAQLYSQPPAMPAEQVIAAKKSFELQAEGPEAALFYAISLEQVEEKTKAGELYERVFAKSPSYRELFALTSITARVFSGVDSALEKLEGLSKRAPLAKTPTVDLLRVALLWEKKRYDEATILLDQLTGRNPQSPSIRFLAAQSHQRQNHWGEALSHYKLVADGSDFYLPARYQMVKILAATGKKGSALREIKSLFSNRFVTWEAYMIASQVYYTSGKVHRAIDMLDQGISRYKKRTELLYWRAALYELLGEDEKALEGIDTVLSLDPTNADAYNFYGYLLAERGQQLEEAEAYILRALAFKPGEPMYLDSLALIYIQRNQFDKALRLLTEANRLAPGEPVILEHIGDAHLGKNDKLTAMSFYQQAFRQSRDTTPSERRDRERIQEKCGCEKET